MARFSSASYWKRFVARIIDVSITVLLVRGTWPLLVRLFAPVLLFFPPPTRQRTQTTIAAVLTMMAVLLIYTMIVYAVCNAVLLKRYGQSIGKRLMKIRIVDVDEMLPSLYTSLWKRELFFFYLLPLILGFVLRIFLSRATTWPLVGLFYAADALSILFRDGRSFHDGFAGTAVCDAYPSESGNDYGM